MENFDPNYFLPNNQNSQAESISIDPELKNKFDRVLAKVAPEFRQEPNPMFTRFPDQSFGLYELNYDRYARRSNFDELGFSPYRDNDALYNSESNFMGELWRGIQGAAMLTGSSSLDMIKGTMDLVTGDWEGFIAPDVSAAKSFEEINRVYGSTKGGTTGFISNGVLQTGFIGGMILGSLPETVALGLITAEAGGVGAWAKIAQTIGRGAKVADATLDAAKITQTAKVGTSAILQNADNVAGANKVASWLSTTAPSLKGITGNPILSFINPLENTTKYFDDMFTAVNAATDLPSVKRGVGAVMRDGQIAKAAVVEASLEGGFTTDAVKQKALNEFYEKNGRLPDEDELAVIESKALEAGARTMAWNMPVIMFTDKLLFAPMLKALDNTIARGVGSTLRKGVEETATGYVGRTVAGKTLTETMKFEGKELAKSLLKPGTYLTRGKNFLTSGLGEGTQEVFQSIVGKTMEDYYGDILADPMNIPRSDIMGYFNETVSNIGAEEGEAFLSGMFVGGLFGSGSSKLVKYAKLAGPQFKTKDENGNMLPTYREKYQAYKEEQQRLNNELAETLNQAFSTPFQVFDKSIRSHADTKKLVAQFRLAEIMGDEKVMRDVAEEIRFNKIFTTLETGTYDAFVSKLTALQQLDDAGVMEATGIDDATQARERLVKTVGRAGEIKNRYKEAKKKYPNPFDYSMYEYGTNSYNTTYMSHRSHEEAVRDYIFLGESIDKLKERNQSLKRTLAQTSIAPKISASEVDYLTSASLLSKEMALLKDEVLVEEAATTSEQKKLIANKKKRLTLLEDYQKKVNDFYEAESKGKGTKLKERALKKSFDSVIKHINSVSGETVQYSEEALNSSFSAVKDYFRNDIENGYLTRQLVTLDSPKSITEYSKRHFAAMNDVFVNKKKYIQRAIDNFTSVAANNKVMHTLKEVGYAFDEKELAEYLENGTLPTQLISLKNGELVDATTEKVKTIVDSILAPFAEEKKAQNEEASRRQAEEEKKKQVPETKVEAEDVKRKKASEALASMSTVQMDNAQRYREMVVAQPELPVIMLEFLEQTNDKRSQDEFVASNDGTKFLAFAAELFKAKATSSFTQDSIFRYLASQEANNSQILNDAFDSYYKGAEYKELSSFIQLFTKPVKVTDFESQLLEGEEIVASYPDQDVYVLKLTGVSNEYGEGFTPDITYMAVNSQRGQIDAIEKSSEFGEGTFGTLESLLPIVEEYIKSGAVTAIAKAKNRFVFEGNILEKGQVIFNSRGTKYQVIDSIDVDPATGTAKGVTIQKVGSKNRPEIIKSFNGYSLQSRLSVPEDATKLDVFEFGMIKRPRSISADDNVLITEFYASVSKEEFLQSLVFQVVPNNQMSLEEKNIAFGGKSENVRVKQRPERARVEVYVQTPSGAKLLFGYINDPAQYAFYSADGVRYTNLNQSLVSSDIFVGKEIKPNVVVDNYNKSMSLYNRLMELSTGKDVAVIPYTELSRELSLNLTRPSYIFSGTDKTSFEKLKYKTYKGRTVVIDKVNGNTAEVITGAPFSFEELEKLNKTVRERTSSFENLGRYVLVSELPNGDVLFTELSSIQMTEQEVLSLINELVSAVSDEKKRGENFASGFNSKFFFSYTGKDTYNDSNIKYAVRFEITNDGNFQIKFNPLNGTVKAEQTIRVERKFTNLQEFVDAVNEGIEKNNKNLESSANLKYVQLAPISVDNFYTNLSKNLSETDLNNTKSNVTDPEMISVGGIRIESFGPAAMSPSLMEMQNTPAPAVVRDEAEKVVIDNNIISEVEDKTNVLQEQLLQKEAELDQYKKGLEFEDTFKNPVLNQLEAEVNDLRQRVNQAYKVLEAYTPEEAEELVKFLSWVDTALPEFITVATVEQIADRMITEGITVGRFATIVKNATEGITGLQGVIEILEDSPAKYHEAFHSVFRMILTDREIQQALREGLSELKQDLNKQGKTLDQLLDEYRVQPFYAQMTEAELLDRVVEEHLADKFEEFKKNPRETKTATTNKSVFRKIIDFLVSLFTDYKPRFESVEDLYEGISSGKFRKAGIVDNKYTRAALNNGGDVAFAVMLNRGSVRVAIGDTTEIIPQYLSSQDTQYILSALSARVYNQLQDTTEAVSLDSVIDSNIIDFAALFNPARYSNVELKERADSIVMALKSPTNRAEIKEHVRNTIKTFDSVSSLLTDFQEEYEEEFGGNTGKQLGKGKEQLDGIKSLPPIVRALISTTPVREADAFGNEFFVDRQGNLTEERIIVPASVSFVYNAVSRLTADSVDEIEMLNRLYSFTQLNSDSARNTHTVQFIQRMFREFNIQPNESGEITREAIRDVKNARAYQAFIKAFDKSKRMYSFTAVDSKNNQSVVYEANRQSEDVTQYDNWRSAYSAKVDSITDELAQEAESIMVDLVSYMKNLAVYDDKVSSIVDEKLARFAEITGIEMIPSFYEYSWYKNKIAEDKLEVADANPVMLAAVRTLKLPFITPDVLSQIGKSLKTSKGAELFVREALEEGAANKTEYAVGGRVRSLAIGNVYFNESIDTTTFNNAEGNKIQTYQARTVFTKLVQNLRRGVPQDPYLEDNFLLSNEEFLNILPEITTESIDGMALRNLNALGTDFNRKAGSVYADYTDAEFFYQMLTNYFNVKLVNGVVTTPTFVRVLEAASTGMTVRLPLTKLVDITSSGYKISNTAIEAVVKEIQRDVKAIGKARAEIDAIEPGTAKFPVIEGYHNGAKRGLKLSHNMRALLGNEVSEKIEADSVTNSQLPEIVQTALTAAFEAFKDKLVYNGLVNKRNGVIELGNRGPLVSVMSTAAFKKSKASSYLDKLSISPVDSNDSKPLRTIKLEANLAQIFFSDFLNTLAFNQIIVGEHNKQFKDSKNVVKRAKGLNASGISASHSTLAPELGINETFDSKGDLKHITFQDGIEDGITTDDGQLYMTTKGLRHILHGMGRLSSKHATLIDKLENGQDVLDYEVFGPGGSISYNGQTNSLKLVYYDGETYLKMSAFVLTQDFTERFSKGGFLDNLRVVLENAEARGGVAFGHPQSASKSVVKNLVSREDINSQDAELLNKFNSLDPNYLYLSTETPSNKTEATDPTQMRSIVMSGFSESDSVYIDGVSYPAKDIVKEFMSLLAKRTQRKYFDRRESLFTIEDVEREFITSIDLGKVTPKLEAFRKEAVETLKSIGATAQEIEIFERPDVNLNNPVTLNRFTTLFLSYFTKAVGKDTVPGYKLTLVSDAGVTVRRLTDTAGKNGLSVDTVVPYSEYLIMSAAEKQNVYSDRLRHDVKVYDKKNNVVETYSEMIMPPHFAGKSLEDERVMHAVRIPSQASQSATNAKVVDYAPAYYGSIAFMPKELVKITGWDFDIDSVFVHRPKTYNLAGKDFIYGEEKTIAEKKAAYFNSLVNNNTEYRDALLEYEDPFNQNLREGLAQNLGLQYSEEAYQNMPEYVDNRMLKIKTALQGSAAVTSAEEGQTPRGYQPMTTDTFDAFGEKLKEFASEFYQFVDASAGIHDSLTGKADAFGNIREGAENIGPAVNGVLAYSLLNYAKVSGSQDAEAGITINGVTYDGFTKLKDEKGNFVSDSLSQIVSVMVDNASNPLARMYGLTLEQTGLAAYLTALGVDLETVLVFINQPAVRYYATALKNAGGTVKSSEEKSKPEEVFKKVKSLISQNIKGLDAEERLSANPVIEDLNYSSLLIEDAVKKMSQSELKNQLAILEQFDKALKQAKIFANFSSLTKLNRGIGKSMEDFERYIELADMFTTEEGIKEIASAGFPTNGLLAAVKNNPHTSSQIQAIRELNKFSRTLFISKTEAFEFVQDALKSSLTGNFLGEGLTKMNTDLLSVITAASYINTLQPGDRRALNLSNALIYERLRDGSNPSSSIVEVVNNLRSYYSKNNKRNRFVEDYLYTNSAKTPDGKVNSKNREQTNRVALNSWSRLSEDITDQLYRDFVDGLTNTDVLSDGTTVRSAFVDLVHYLLVKDGLNFKTGSFLSYVPAIALKEIFAANNKAIEVLKDFDSMLLKSSVTFGESLSKFVGEFMINWPKHASNNSYIKSLFKPEYGNTSEEAKIYDKLFEKVSEDRFNISLFGFKNGFSQEIDYNLEDEGYAEYLKLVSPVFSAGGMQTVNTPVGVRTLFPLYLKVDKDLYKLHYYTPSKTEDGRVNDYINNGKITINSSNVAGVLNATKKDLKVNGFVGSFAQYEKVTVKGNRSQMGGGYIFGELPDYNLLEVDKTEASLKTPANVAVVPRTSPEAISNRASAVVNSISEMTSAEDPDSPIIPGGESNLASVGRRKKVPTSIIENLSTYELTDSDREVLKKVYEEKSFTVTDVPESANIDMSDYASFMGYVQEALGVNKDIRNINDLADRIKTCYGITINL